MGSDTVFSLYGTSNPSARQKMRSLDRRPEVSFPGCSSQLALCLWIAEFQAARSLTSPFTLPSFKPRMSSETKPPPATPRRTPLAHVESSLLESLPMPTRKGVTSAKQDWSDACE